MLRRLLLPVVFILLAWGFWISPEFKEIAAGVAVFLFGMLVLEEGCRIFSGGLLERFLRRSTDKLWKALGFGVVSTTLMQSSSLVSVITISFLSAGMIDLYAGLGIVFGANLGTTTGAWLVAGFGLKVKISAYAMPMLVFGVIMIFQKAKGWKGFGHVLVGLGFLFLGIHYMKDGFETFKGAIDLSTYAVAGYPGLFLFSLIGILATVVMQSSHATLVLTITALASGQVTYDNALALAIGANVGTTITAILGAMGAGVKGRRLAGGHLIFNLVTGLVAIGFIHQFMSAVDWISNEIGIGAKDYTLKLAIFHTLFNLAGVVLMVPVMRSLVRLLEWAMPEKAPNVSQPQYLNDAALEFVETAVGAVRKETLHLYDEAFKIIAHGIDLHRTEILSEVPFTKILADRRNRDRIHIDLDESYERSIKVLDAAILHFISRAQVALPRGQGEALFDYRRAARCIVASVKDVKHLRKNLSRFKGSHNASIRMAYDVLRGRLGNVLRQIGQLRADVHSEEDVAISDLDTLRLEIQSSDSLTGEALDLMIREELITPEMGTSLINDHAYADSACQNLIDMAGVLFAPKDQDDLAAQQSIALTTEEIDDLAEEGAPEMPEPGERS